MQQSAPAEAGWSAVTSLTRFPQKTNPLVTGLVIGLGFAVSGAQAVPPAVDATSSVTASQPTSMTVSHTTSGTDRLMLVGISFDPQANPTVTQVRYNGLPLIWVGTRKGSTEARMDIWKMLAPPAVTADVVVTFSKPLEFGAVVGVTTFTAVDQTTPLGTFTSDDGATSTATVDIASSANDLVFAVVDVEQSGPLTVGPDQTTQWLDGVPPKPYAGGSTEAGAATVTMSWSLTGADSWAIGGVSIKGLAGPTLTLSDHDSGQESDAFTDSGSETDAELFAFKLDPGPDTISVMLMIFRISEIAGLTDADWAASNLEIIQDDVVVDGNIGAGETTSVGGLWVVDQAGGTITFSPSFSVSAVTSYILRATFSSLSEGDRVTIVLNPSDITTTASETVSGSTTAVTHKEGCFYEERFQQWSATNPVTWEVKDLSGAPFNVPANAVVEVAVRNSKANEERYGGVRAVGSVLDRRLLLQEAEIGGMSVVVMHVQVDASSQIRHYSHVKNDVDFVLLGYWDCGTYVEAFQSFTAGADASWQDRDLSTYGVGSSQVAEIVLTNSDPFNEWEAGVRTKGSTRQRIFDIQEAEAGGVDTATMFVNADATATIEVYAQDNLSITFYLVGYFTTAPRTYTESFSSIGSPTTSATWQDVDLTSRGVVAQSVAEISMANKTLAAEHNMGVRENGSTRARLLDLQEAEAGGGDFGRMHVTADATATIEFYKELISDPGKFYLTGIWGDTGPVTPRVIRWSEVDPFGP